MNQKVILNKPRISGFNTNFIKPQTEGHSGNFTLNFMVVWTKTFLQMWAVLHKFKLSSKPRSCSIAASNWKLKSDLYFDISGDDIEVWLNVLSLNSVALFFFSCRFVFLHLVWDMHGTVPFDCIRWDTYPPELNYNSVLNQVKQNTSFLFPEPRNIHPNSGNKCVHNMPARNIGTVYYPLWSGYCKL